MLSDIERKTLRIIHNFQAGRKRLPSLSELCVKTGCSRGGIMEVLKVLAEETYIEWHYSRPDELA
ncbi:GntR family transcriptional regulator [Brevibacillus massiliensis]|uniref:GntR family transcriptional regulator n=1 Tax=Brevibacillus massiliensis TaxID=1118054 RepID=UPI000309F2D3|nr:GntR family transcriptional regulator [Brevibacillus massiliensis]